MEVSFTVKAPLAISGSNFTLEAKLFSLADPTIFATHDIDVASLSDAQGAALVDLTQAREGV